MSSKYALTEEALAHLTVGSSGSLTVDLEGYFKSDAGKVELGKLKKLDQAVKKHQSAAASEKRPLAQNAKN
jgi:hypothetical protein